MPVMEIPKTLANCLEELTNYMARGLAGYTWGWCGSDRRGTMYLLAYLMNQCVIVLKRNIQQQGGYGMFPPKGKKHGSRDH